MKGFIAFVVLTVLPSGAQILHFMPTSVVVKIASMAARDEGYDPDQPGTFLDNLRTPDGKEPYSGYTSIGL